jgi:hypothetical protein
MGLWKVPETILLPAEADIPESVFEFNGRLANGDQVLAYVGERRGETHPPTTPFVNLTAVLLRFDASGALLTVRFATTAYDGDHVEQNPERAYRKARRLLEGMVGDVKAEGWSPAGITVRPFCVVVDGFETGLVYQTDGEYEEPDPEDPWTPEMARLRPFGYIFYRPWNDGVYST